MNNYYECKYFCYSKLDKNFSILKSVNFEMVREKTFDTKMKPFV